VERVEMNALEKEQLAAQLVAVMDAHFERPDPNEKRYLLRLAEQQIQAAEITKEREATLCNAA